MDEKIEISRQQLEELLRQNKQMKKDLGMIVHITGDILGMIAGKSINAVTIFSTAPRIISDIQNDPVKAAFLQPDNIERLKKSYGP